MTPLVVILAILQAAILFVAAVWLSTACLRMPRWRPALAGLAALGAAIALSRYTQHSDPYRVLCTLGDCIVLTLCVVGVRIFFMSGEAERLLEERRIAAQADADAAIEARRANAGALVQAAAVALENRATPATPPAKPAAGHAPERGMTLVEVVTAMCLIAMVSVSLIAASVLTRRLTEVAVYQSSVAAIMQGFLEQIKNMPYEMLPLSPPSGTSMTGSTYTSMYALATQKDDVTPDPLILSPLSPLSPANVNLPTVPSGVYDNTKTFDVNRAADLTIHLWVWIEDQTPSGFGATQQVKAITLLYMWQFQDGATTRSYKGMIKTMRSVVPTY